jgi:hypothetical protein
MACNGVHTCSPQMSPNLGRVRFIGRRRCVRADLPKTTFSFAGLNVGVIAQIMASEETVEKIIRLYVGRQAATKEAIERLNEARQRTDSAKLPAKL